MQNWYMQYHCTGKSLFGSAEGVTADRVRGDPQQSDTDDHCLEC